MISSHLLPGFSFGILAVACNAILTEILQPQIGQIKGDSSQAKKKGRQQRRPCLMAVNCGGTREALRYPVALLPAPSPAITPGPVIAVIPVIGIGPVVARRPGIDRAFNDFFVLDDLGSGSAARRRPR